MASHRYVFRPVTEDDLSLVRRWLKTPEVRRWWGDPDTEFGLIEEDMSDERMVTLLKLDMLFEIDG